MSLQIGGRLIYGYGLYMAFTVFIICTEKVSNFAFREAWKWVPSIRKRQSNTLKPLNEANIPTEERSVRMFEAQGGQLQRECRVGQDLLSGDDVRQQQREQLFFEEYSFEDIFTALMGGNTKPFKSGLKYFMKLTYSL